MKIAKPLLRVIESFERLPGIGPKTAQRLAYYLLHVPQSYLEEFAGSLENLKKETVLCSICKNVGEIDPCVICADTKRDAATIMVVESPIDILVFEATGNYNGLYHVLHGAINPLENIGPDEIYIEDLFQRLKNGSPVRELILATNPTMEGEATAMYISKKAKESNPLRGKSSKPKITRLGRGVPTGADLEHADGVTLTQALEGRREF